ncbi:MAG: galactose oxidase-like domain-containing protein [Acidimicrobiia bacterium]
MLLEGEQMMGAKSHLARGLSSVATMATIALVAPATAPAAGEEALESWSTPITLRTPDGWYASPIHGGLLPDGRVFLWGVSRSDWPTATSDPGRPMSFVLDPRAAVDGNLLIDEIPQPVEIDRLLQGNLVVSDSYYCAGQSITADGKVFTAGGTRAWTDQATNAAATIIGLQHETIFDPSTDEWSRLPGAMVGNGQLSVAARWYPTVTRLPDGRMLVTAGFERVKPTAVLNFSTETYDPATGARAVGSTYGTTPLEIVNRDYTHVFTLPYASAAMDLLMIGEPGRPVLNSSRNLSRWSALGPARPGAAGQRDAGYGQSSVMLPLRVRNREWGYSNGSILVTGGRKDTPLMQQADVYDPIRSTWQPSIATGVMRHHPATVGLPDGRILVLAGHNMLGDSGVLGAQYIDPANGFAVTDAAGGMTQTRGYHTVSLLLPDGKILLAGGRDSDTETTLEKPTLQYFSPDYMAKVRPTITGAPATLSYGGTFPITVDGAPPSEVVLVGLGSMTHSFDSNQRVVQLPVGKVQDLGGGSYRVITGGPKDAHVAPPGHYMMFVLDGDRIPSVATMVRVV